MESDVSCVVVTGRCITGGQMYHRCWAAGQHCEQCWQF